MNIIFFTWYVIIMNIIITRHLLWDCQNGAVSQGGHQVWYPTLQQVLSLHSHQQPLQQVQCLPCLTRQPLQQVQCLPCLTCCCSQSPPQLLQERPTITSKVSMATGWKWCAGARWAYFSAFFFSACSATHPAVMVEWSLCDWAYMSGQVASQMLKAY